MERFVTSYKLPVKDAARLVEEKSTADYFEEAVKRKTKNVSEKTVANWILGELFGLMKTRGETADRLKVRPEALAELVSLVAGGEINQVTGREVLAEMSESGKLAAEIVEARGLRQVSDTGFISEIVRQTLEECPGEVTSFRSGREAVLNFLFGQVMKKAAGKANPQVVRVELVRQLKGS
jgi:aspartyl-tRNA(Asn)/glutamyl-tRNA(Gln) amidotransferase subunit B